MPQFIAKNYIIEYEDTLEIEVIPAFNDLVVVILREIHPRDKSV